MARKKRRGHRTGSVITTRRVNGLGNIKQPGSVAGTVVPVAAGAVVTGGVMLAAENLITPDGTGGVMDKLHEYAPVVGIAAGAATAVGMRYMVGKPAAWMTAAASILLGGAFLVKKYVDTMPATHGVGYMYRGRRQMGAVVAETMNGLPAGGVGAIVMEPYGQQGYGNSGGGEKVSLGAINPAAFGTTAFDM